MIRVNELAKTLSVSNREILAVIEQLGIEGKTHSSNLQPDLVEKITAKLTTKTPEQGTASKPRPFNKQKPNQQPQQQAARPVTPAATPPMQKSHEQKPQEQRQKPHEQKPHERSHNKPPAKFPSTDVGAPPVLPVPPAVATGAEEEEDVVIPDRFKKKVDIEKVEKVKPKLSMQRAFQSIRKVEQKKIFDTRTGKKSAKGRQIQKGMGLKQPLAPTAPRKKLIKIQEGATVSDFAHLIGQKISEVIKKFMELGTMPTINQVVDMDAAIMVAEAFGIKVEAAEVENYEAADESADDENLIPRPPVVTIMGHVDHGKTSLLDALRKTKVTESEAGGITQHIGAYKVRLKGKEIVFLDTPGHEAFTSMRARGAKVTDIVVLVVAADDGVMPQTIEAIDHARAANVPIVVAINKIDKGNADVDRIKKELSEHEVISEEWGGKNIFVQVSAKKLIGIEDLLEMIVLQAEMMELRANPDKPARGVVIESRLDKGRGAVATVLIQSGKLRVSDVFVTGFSFGKVRALVDDEGAKITEAGPSTPVEVVGFSDVPDAGESFMVVDEEKRARQIVMARRQKTQTTQSVHPKKLNLDELYAKIKEQAIKELNIIIKSDVQGSAEALKSSLENIKHEEVKVKVIHSSTGGINDSDVMLASASNAIIIGFNVRADAKSSKLAEREGVDIRFYNVIYDAIDDVKKALEGLLEPTLKEVILGTAEVKQTFYISKIGTVAGCLVTEGSVQRSADGIRVIRDNIVIFDGKIDTLKRFKDDVKEALKGYECGIVVENYNDLKAGDVLENYKIEKIAGKL
ncbi:translation initiation factor IF-2 [Candidatus Magnetomonas plexicatena]|uniref:translation initiation factor IF-2 n=1 Tax=Candidatus Magnetomonas plexicatena TaxID=2552947 RepID=UPI0040330295